MIKLKKNEPLQCMLLLEFTYTHGYSLHSIAGINTDDTLLFTIRIPAHIYGVKTKTAMIGAVEYINANIPVEDTPAEYIKL